MPDSVSKPLLIAMVGLPRSGKSTFARQLAKHLGAPIVSRDALRLAVHGQRYAKEAEPLIKAMSLYAQRMLFATGSPIVIVDETNYSKEAREALKDDNWDVQFMEVPTDVVTCVSRTYETNQPDLHDVIESMWKRRDPLGDDEPRYIPPLKFLEP